MSLTEIDWSKIPAPADDGKARHLPGTALPDLTLPATDGREVNLADLDGPAVIYIYPMTGRPDRGLPDKWDMTPGARGCTPQACAFRDQYGALEGRGLRALFGLSIQDTAYQKEAASRLHLPFPLLSDANGHLRQALDLPVMEVEGQTLLKRLTLMIRDGKIDAVNYPVFPPDRDVDRVLDWLEGLD